MEPQAGFEHWMECVREVQSLQVVEKGQPFKFADLGDLNVAPPPRQWLCKDARTDAPLLPMNKPFILTSDGGLGKSYVMLMFAVCVGIRVVHYPPVRRV